MADVKIIDIDSAQWNMKDQDARNRIAEIEQSLIPNTNEKFKITLNDNYTGNDVKIYYQQNYGKLHMGIININDLLGENVGTTNSIEIGTSNINSLNSVQALGYDYSTSAIVRIEISVDNKVRLLESKNVIPGNNRLRIPFIWIEK